MNQTTVETLDFADPLAKMRQEFLLPDNCIYLCGHSLGALAKRSTTQVNKMMLEQCGQMGVRAWNDADWIHLPENLGNKIAKLIGAKKNEVTITDSTSINLFKLLMAGLKLNPDKNVILTEADNFPTDLYIAQTVADLNLNVKLIRCHRSEIKHLIDDKTAILFLSHVDYRTGELHDMQAMTDLAHQHGALMLYDVSHSAGIYPLTLSTIKVDMAVGCTYKYLNGGPGAPAFLYVAEQHQSVMNSPLTGWMGHHSPFEFSANYIPAPDVRKFLCGTPAILSMGALDASVDVFSICSLTDIRKKSQLLSELFIELLAEKNGDLELVSPKEAELRGSHIAYTHQDAYAISRALAAAGIVCDYRAPNFIRFGFSPLYIRYIDIFNTVSVLATILNEKSYCAPQFKQKVTVT